MIRKIVLATLLAAPLAACMQAEPISTPPIDASIKNPAVNGSRVLSYRQVAIRTHYILDEERLKETSGEPSSDNKKEVTGARCTLESAEFKATVVTPAHMNIPTLKRRPTPLRIDCVLGAEKGTKSIQPTLDGVVVGGASAAGLLAAAVTAGIAAGRDSWSYGVPAGTNFSVQLK